MKYYIGKSFQWTCLWRIEIQYRSDRHEGYVEINDGWGNRKGIAFTTHEYSLFKVMKIFQVKKWYFWFYDNKPFIYSYKDKLSIDVPRILPRWKELDDYYRLET